MKNLLITILMLSSMQLFAQNVKTVRGDGNVQKESRTVSPFTSLTSSGSMNIEIASGNSNTIQVEADANLLPYIETTVSNGELTVKIKNKTNISNAHKMTVYISMAKIRSIKQSGSGNIHGEGNFTSDGKTDVSLSGSGNITLRSVSFDDVDF